MRRQLAARVAWMAALLLCGAVSVFGQEGAEGASPELGIGWKWANFAILAIGLGYLLAKSLPPFFKSRTESIQKGISEAQQVKREAEARALEIERRVSALGADIDKFRDESRVEIGQEGERIRLETERQIARVQQQAQQEIEAAAKTAQKELKVFASRLALDLAEKRIRERLDQSTENALVDDFVKSLQNQGSRN